MSDILEEIRTVHVVLPEHTNHYGTLFAGEALKMMSAAAYAAATRCVRKNVVMAAVDSTVFKDVVNMGDIIEIIARVVHMGDTSLHVTVDVNAEDRLEGEPRTCVQARFIMVSVNDKGRPESPFPTDHLLTQDSVKE